MVQRSRYQDFYFLLLLHNGECPELSMHIRKTFTVPSLSYCASCYQLTPGALATISTSPSDCHFHTLKSVLLSCAISCHFNGIWMWPSSAPLTSSLSSSHLDHLHSLLPITTKCLDPRRVCVGGSLLNTGSPPQRLTLPVFGTCA